MRVYRLEANRKTPCGWNRTLRPDRYGAFSSDLIPGRLYHRVPTPHQDFGVEGDYDSYKHNPELFFAFPTLEYVIEFAQDIQSEVFISVYEVDVVRSSQHQVLFHYTSAVFISEQTIRDFRESLTLQV